MYTNVSLVETLDYEPSDTVVVIGGGSKTAVEYGCFFSATGRRTIMPVRSECLKIDARRRDPGLRSRPHARARHRDLGAFRARPDRGRRQRPRSRGRHPHAEGRGEDQTNFVFVGLGETPNSEPAVKALGVEVGPKNEVVVDDQLRTSVPKFMPSAT